METLYEKAEVAKNYLVNNLESIPEIAIILGTGLGNLVEEIEDPLHIPYRNIPHFPLSTVPSHAGEMVVGNFEGKTVLLLSGRIHFYEGYSMEEITFPIRLLKLLEIKTLIITNAAGGVNPDYEAGDIIVVNDHINMLPENPLRGTNDDRFGPRFPDMMYAYNPELIELSKTAFKKLDFPYKTGVYVAIQGPSLETPAEYAFVNKIGGDLVGMSTVPEVIVAHHSGINVLVLSTVSNVCFPLDRLSETSLEDVVKVAGEATPKLTAIIREVLRSV